MSNQKIILSKEITLEEHFKKMIEWLNYLKIQWLKIALFGLIGGCIGFAYAWMKPITYTAKLIFVVEEGKSASSSLGGLASLAGQLGVDFGSGGGGGGLLTGENIFLYFKSNSLAREVLLSMYDSATNKTVADFYADTYKLKENWKKNSSVGEIKFHTLSSLKPYTRTQDSLIQKLTESILAEQFSVMRADKNGDFIEVSVTMENEELAKTYCERIVNKAINQYINIKVSRQKATVEKLQARVDSLARLLNQKTVSGATLQTSTSTMDINPIYRAGSVVATETTLRDKTMIATVFSSVTQNLELAKFTLSQETPVIQVVDKPIYPLKKEKKSKLKTAITFSLGFGLLMVLYLAVKKIIEPLI
jgi:uncharacterized protein involved in exopolysaccharide biosynthesis